LTSTSTEPERPIGLSRDSIVGAAIMIGDSDGLEAVSIRRVAAELGARPMSLYTYIASKDDLLALMANEIVAEVIVPGQLPGDWREALRAIARRSHATFVAHPWVLAISGRRPHLGHNALRHADQLLAAVAPLRLEPKTVWNVLYVVNDYTLGHALRVASAPRDGQESYPEFDPAAFPHLAQALETEGPERGEPTFEAGLEALLDGIERRYGRRRRSGAPAGTTYP
jgi:AcrR family transcriptional regulator